MISPGDRQIQEFLVMLSHIFAGNIPIFGVWGKFDYAGDIVHDK
ncbi:12138_t:CDS:1, partial [Funneliformis caledonium]